MFFFGAGISKPAELPDSKELTYFILNLRNDFTFEDGKAFLKPESKYVYDYITSQVTDSYDIAENYYLTRNDYKKLKHNDIDLSIVVIKFYVLEIIKLTQEFLFQNATESKSYHSNFKDNIGFEEILGLINHAYDIRFYQNNTTLVYFLNYLVENGIEKKYLLHLLYYTIAEINAWIVCKLQSKITSHLQKLKLFLDKDISWNIATLNYDILIEKYLSESKIMYNDGFGNLAKEFTDANHNQLKYYKFDSTFSNNCNLFKIHGSIDWKTHQK